MTLNLWLDIFHFQILSHYFFTYCFYPIISLLPGLQIKVCQTLLRYPLCLMFFIPLNLKKDFKKYFYLFSFRGEGRKRERNINVWLPLAGPQLGTWSATQACALTGNQTCDPLFPRLALNPLSHTSQGSFLFIHASFQVISYALSSESLLNPQSV